MWNLAAAASLLDENCSRSASAIVAILLCCAGHTMRLMTPNPSLLHLLQVCACIPPSILHAHMQGWPHRPARLQMLLDGTPHTCPGLITARPLRAIPAARQLSGPQRLRSASNGSRNVAGAEPLPRVERETPSPDLAEVCCYCVTDARVWCRPPTQSWTWCKS